MSVHINLLPDVRQHRLRNQRRRRLATSVGLVVSGTAVGIVVLLIIYIQAQHLQLSGLQHQIDTSKAAIKATPNLDKILSTQASLNSLPQLYAQRSRMSNFISVLSSVSPTDIALSQVDIDANNAIRASGLGRNYLTVAKLAESLKAKRLSDGTPAFASVSVSDLSADQTGRVSFTVSAVLAKGVTDATQP